MRLINFPKTDGTTEDIQFPDNFTDEDVRTIVLMKRDGLRAGGIDVDSIPIVKARPEIVLNALPNAVGQTVAHPLESVHISARAVSEQPGILFAAILGVVALSIVALLLRDLLKSIFCGLRRRVSATIFRLSHKEKGTFAMDLYSKVVLTLIAMLLGVIAAMDVHREMRQGPVTVGEFRQPETKNGPTRKELIKRIPLVYVQDGNVDVGRVYATVDVSGSVEIDR